MTVLYHKTLNRVCRISHQLWLRALLVRASDVVFLSRAPRLFEAHLLPQTAHSFSPHLLKQQGFALETLITYLSAENEVANGLRRTLQQESNPELQQQSLTWLYHPLEVRHTGTVIAVVFGETSLINATFPERSTV
jgi:hypothetical protein